MDPVSGEGLVVDCECGFKNIYNNNTNVIPVSSVEENALVIQYVMSWFLNITVHSADLMTVSKKYLC